MSSEPGFSWSDLPGVKDTQIFSDTVKDGFIPEVNRYALDFDPKGYIGWKTGRDRGFPFFDDNHPVSKVVRPIIEDLLEVFLGFEEELEFSLT